MIQGSDLPAGIDIVHIDEMVRSAKRHTFAIRAEGDAFDSLMLVKFLGRLVAGCVEDPRPHWGDRSFLGKRDSLPRTIKHDHIDPIEVDNPRLATVAIEYGRTAWTNGKHLRSVRTDC